MGLALVRMVSIETLTTEEDVLLLEEVIEKHNGSLERALVCVVDDILGNMVVEHVVHQILKILK